MDQHIRATFDMVPLPPRRGAKGADKITFFGDSDHDGVYDKSTDAITGLNIATSVVLGRGKIWVLNPPYLVAYRDGNNDGIPDGPSVVHFEGFGLEDTHAVANNLCWGPDGWLYGAQGSTCTADIKGKKFIRARAVFFLFRIIIRIPTSYIQNDYNYAILRDFNSHQ